MQPITWKSHQSTCGPIGRTTPRSRRYLRCLQVPAQVDVLSSHDGGATWSSAIAVPGMYWANFFLHDGAVYMLGTGGVGGGAITIARSDDGGSVWRSAELFRWPGRAVGSYATGATPVLVAEGRLWRAFELWRPPHRCARCKLRMSSLGAERKLSLRAAVFLRLRLVTDSTAITAAAGGMQNLADQVHKHQVNGASVGGLRTSRPCSSRPLRAQT